MIRLYVLVVVLVGVLCACKTPQSEVKPDATPVVEETTPAVEQQCETDADCVKASCCHATACVPVAQKPDCERVMCTMSCTGPMDCGKGHCACIDGMCTVKTAEKILPPDIDKKKTTE